MRLTWLAVAALTITLGGCLSDADTANNRSVLSPAAQTGRAAHGDAPSDEPRQLCESTVEGGESKMICY